jgi:peptidoglycan/LPS O-acetylase OafA/YrhL
VFITRHLRRPAQLFAIACALVVPAGAAYAAADPQLAQERYYMSFAPADEPQGSAAQERYYSSYGDPKPLTAPQSPPSSETPWIAIALSIAGALAIVAVSATQLRRIRVRRRRAAHTPA